MEVFYEITKLNHLSLALGFFDGIHMGHRAVINNAVILAKSNNTKSAVITFKEHPKNILSKTYINTDIIYNNIKTIIDNETKIKLIDQLEVDYLFLLDFNKYRYLLAIDFLEILVKYLSPTAITTGFNYYFGYKKSGNTALLANMSSKYNYKYFEIGAVKYNNTVVSSTLIRELINKKQWKEVNILLGYDYKSVI